MEELSAAMIIGLSIKIYALMTPTAVLSYFIAHTRDDGGERLRIAFKTGVAIFVIGETLFLFGRPLFTFFGFTIDAFRIGVGVLLFLSAVRLMNGEEAAPPPPQDADISVVPLAIPLGMGPSAIGWVMVLGSSAASVHDVATGTLCLLIASAAMIALLCLAKQVRHFLGRTGLAVMAKLSALILSAMAAQVIFTGIRAFLSAR